MKLMILTALAATALTGGHALTTKYTTDRAIKYEIESSMTMETTSMEAERDGEPQDMPAHGMKMENSNTEVHIDRVMEVADGKPTKVHRKFEKVANSSTMTMGEDERTNDSESPFTGVTLELVLNKDGAVEASAIDGKAPEHDKAMEGHHLDSFLDGLLPSGEVDVDATWDLEKAGIARALRLDMRKTLFPPPERGDRGEGGGGGGGRRGGMRGGGGAGGMLDDAAWKGTAKLISADKEVDGVHCAIVELKIEASGEREMPAMGRRRGQMFGAEALPFENKATYDARLEGTFAFAIKEHRPVKLELKGTLHTESRFEMSGEEHSMKMHSVQDGKIDYSVAVSEEAVTAEKTEKKAEKDSK